MEKWRCIKCGACCYLDPEERPDLDQYLTPDELKLYLSMVKEDGWCINYDHTVRECKIYDQRPRFCRVETETFTDMYGLETDEINDFAIDCCRQQIGSLYGDRSLEMEKFNQEILKP